MYVKSSALHDGRLAVVEYKVAPPRISTTYVATLTAL